MKNVTPEFRTHIFVRPGSTWQHSVTLAPFMPLAICVRPCD